MKKSELELARKNGYVTTAIEHGVTVRPIAYSSRWVAYLGDKEIASFTKCGDLVKYLSDNNIKINN